MLDLNTKGKILKIEQGGESLVSNDLYIDGEISLKTSSSFSPLWKASSNNLMNLVSSSFTFNGMSLPSGQFAMQGVQIWESTEPLNFSIKANLYMKDNAYEDVFSPSLTLMELSLPMIDTESSITDAYTEKYNIQLKSLIPPGPNLTTILTDIGLGGVFEIGGLKSTKSRGVYNIIVGDYLTISNVIVKGVDCTFSSILSEDNFPVSSELNFEFTTMEIATTNMLVGMKKLSKTSE